MNGDNLDKLRDAYMEAVLDRITSVRYPSMELMDRVEFLAHKREYAEMFVAYLIDSVEGGQYPSHQMMDRIERILYGVSTPRSPQ
jgi:hypothetical protein